MQTRRMVVLHTILMTQTALDNEILAALISLLLYELDKSLCREGRSPIPVKLNHNYDLEVEQFFERVKNEQKGQLDLLVNNAYSGVGIINECKGNPFYECPTPNMWDKINGLGLRNHYLCTVYASRIMVENRTGLIVNISSGGGLKYLVYVNYGIGKAACDRMAADCSVELKNKNVTMVSHWRGPVKTEEITNRVLENHEARYSHKIMFESGESTEFTGMAIVKLASDQNKIQCTGNILFKRKYDIKNLDSTTTGDMF